MFHTWQRKVRDATNSKERIFPHRRIRLWADRVLTHCRSSINVSRGVFSFSAEPSHPRNLCQRQSVLTRWFARKSWPLLNMTEAVSDLLLPFFFFVPERKKRYFKKSGKRSSCISQKTGSYVLLTMKKRVYLFQWFGEYDSYAQSERLWLNCCCFLL